MCAITKVPMSGHDFVLNQIYNYIRFGNQIFHHIGDHRLWTIESQKSEEIFIGGFKDWHVRILVGLAH